MAAYWKPIAEPPQHEGLCLCKAEAYPYPFFAYWSGTAFVDGRGFVVPVRDWRSVMAGHELEHAISGLWVARGGKL